MEVTNSDYQLFNYASNVKNLTIQMIKTFRTMFQLFQKILLMVQNNFQQPNLDFVRGKNEYKSCQSDYLRCFWQQLLLQTNRRNIQMLNSNTLITDKSSKMLRSLNQLRNHPQKWKEQKKSINFKSGLLKTMRKANCDLPLPRKSTQRLPNIQNRNNAFGSADNFMGASMIYTNNKMEKVVMKINLNESADLLKIQKVNTRINLQKQSLGSKKNIRNENEDQSSQNVSIAQRSVVRKKPINKVSIFFQKNVGGLLNREFLEGIQDNQDLEKEGSFKNSSQVNFSYYRSFKAQCIEQFKKVEIPSQKKVNKLIFTLEEGNGGQYVEAALRKRNWWSSKKDSNDQVIFQWTQLRKKDFFCQQQQNNQQKGKKQTSFSLQTKDLIKGNSQITIKIHNHLKNIKYLTSKLCLYQISLFSEKNNLKIPKKYFIQSFLSKQWMRFTEQNLQFQSQQKNILLNYLKQSNNYWIVKNAFNQSNNRILQIFKTFDQITLFLSVNLSNGPIIIQQYINDPFLYKNHKFDIKAYVLLVKIHQNLQAYIYKEGIVSICSQIYDIMNRDPFVHFAKDSIQINSEKFGQIQPSNMINFDQLNNYIQQNTQNGISFTDNIFPEMTNLASHVIQKVSSKLVSQNQPSFQLVEFSYILDKSLKPWLININANPCMQVFNEKTEKIFTKLIDHTFHLTLDVLYPPPPTFSKNKFHHFTRPQSQNNFKPINLDFLSSLQSFTFTHQSKIQDPIDKYDNNSQQQQMALMYFFPQKMRSLSRKSINFRK